MKQNLKKIFFIFFLIIIILTLIYFAFFSKKKIINIIQDDFEKYVNILKKIDYKIPKKNFKIPMYYINL